MSIITFWSQGREQVGKSVAVGAIATSLAIKHNLRILVIGTEYNIDFTGKSTEEIKVISDYIKYIEYLNTWNGILPEVLTDNNASIIIPIN